MGTKVKFFRHDDVGVPQVTTTAGTLVAALDVILVNGTTPVSISSIVVSSGVATVTTSSAHGITAITGASGNAVFPVVKIAGANQAGLNGEFRVASITSTTVFTFATSEPNETATGTMTVCRAPLGFEILFTDTNRRAYRSKNVTSTQCVLYIDDTYASGKALVCMFESMSDINTGSHRVPDSMLVTDTYLEWGHAVYSTQTPKKFILFGDDKRFYLVMENPWGGNFQLNKYEWMKFGDFISYSPSDSKNCLIVGNETKGATGEDQGVIGGWTFNRSNYPAGNAGVFVCRDYSNTSSIGKRISVVWPYTYAAVIDYPNPAGSTLAYAKVLLLENVSTNKNTIRGEIAGVYASLHNTPHPIAQSSGTPQVNNSPYSTHLDVTDKIGNWNDNRFVTVSYAGNTNDNVFDSSTNYVGAIEDWY